jgi:hypothetical protein
VARASQRSSVINSCLYTHIYFVLFTNLSTTLNYIHVIIFQYRYNNKKIRSRLWDQGWQVMLLLAPTLKSDLWSRNCGATRYFHSVSVNSQFFTAWNIHALATFYKTLLLITSFIAWKLWIAYLVNTCLSFSNNGCFHTSLRIAGVSKNLALNLVSCSDL